MGVRYRRNMCECLGGRPDRGAACPACCARLRAIWLGGLIVESESFAGRERGCDKSEKTQCYGVVWARPHSLSSGAELNAVRTEAWIAPRDARQISHTPCLPEAEAPDRLGASARARGRPGAARPTAPAPRQLGYVPAFRAADSPCAPARTRLPWNPAPLPWHLPTGS